MCRNSNALKFLALGVALVTATSVTYADEDRDSARSGEPPLIIDTTAPPGLTGEKKLQWEQRQQEIWRHADEHFNHIQRGDRFFQQNQYREALQEYMQAAQKAAISPELLQAKRRIAGALEALGNFSAALSEVEFLIEQTLNERTREEYKLWKSILEEAGHQQYASAIQNYHKLLASVADWERPVIEQRLRLMEERAHAAGQLSTKTVEHDSSVSE